ncbi:hypothetical protein EV698_1509 [Spiribacter vilamensis]|uniref:Uncharacterized protein n=1 Tax=Spiribacter vilamensis TaxID=531306 RepID=A0A4V2GJ78_9GAMM|nr:hypothetical protein EV698_1509 [Spiribacter vilamensis]
MGYDLSAGIRQLAFRGVARGLYAVHNRICQDLFHESADVGSHPTGEGIEVISTLE